MTETLHLPVMLTEVRELLAPALQKPGQLLVDATLGLGGHASALMSDNPQAQLCGIDRDPQALRLAGERLERAGFMPRCRLISDTFDSFAQYLPRRADAFLFDLGVSSMQIDQDQRGFSYMRDAVLDMRMGGGRLTAESIINDYSEADLVRVFRDYGQERYAPKLARQICRRRQQERITHTLQLARLIEDNYPAAARKGHPAKRVFQALRIEVNDELTILQRALTQALELLAPGGRIVVLAYHSLEDRLVKQLFRAASASDDPAGLPIVQHEPEYRLIGRDKKLPTAQEVADNSRAASVRLRAVERRAARKEEKE